MFAMLKYQPSKSFVYIMIPSCVLVAALGFGLLPELEDLEARPIPGEITFKNAKPEMRRTTTVSARTSPSFGWPMDWFEKGYESLMTWEYNPWKRPSMEFGEHYFKLIDSKNPRDRAKCRELQRLAEAWHQKLRLRFPELAVALRNVPDERNGFLKWLDFFDRMKAISGSGEPHLDFPKELSDYLIKKESWNSEAAKLWLTQQKPLLDEIRAIGLMPERSANGIPVDRWGFFPTGLAKSCGDALMIEARLAAEEGNPTAALESVRAVKGLADHLSEIETPTLLSATVQILMQLSLETRVLNEIIPALPAGQVDPAAWENALNPTVSGPAEFARLMKGEWSVGSRHFLLPMLLDAEEPKLPPDPGELLDAYSLNFLEIARIHEAADIKDLPTLEMPPAPDSSHLSRASRGMTEVLSIGCMSWRKGWDRAQSVSAMTQAAFAIMKGQPIPNDPIYGQPYVWDPTTRKLSPPNSEVFQKIDLKPIIVPKP